MTTDDLKSTYFYKRRCAGCPSGTYLYEHGCQSSDGIQWCECPCDTDELLHRAESWNKEPLSIPEQASE